MKKRIFLICGSGLLALGIITGGIVVGAGDFSKEDINIANGYNQITNMDKDSLYSDYTEKTLVSNIKDKDGVLDCNIDTYSSNGEIVSADVSVVADKAEKNDLKTEILDYVSEFLGIEKENIRLSFQ